MSILKYLPLKSLAVASAVGFLAFKLVSNRSATMRDKCVLIETVSDWELYEAKIINEFINSKVIGLDCEWVTVEDKRKPVSLLQLANKEGFCVLIRLSCMPEWSITALFSPLLENKFILKVGVGVYEDVNKLFNDYGLDVNNFLDLRYLAHDVEELQGKSLSLKSLAYELLNIDLNKSKSLRCSNWDAPILSKQQVNYAADDAIVAAKIFAEIKRRKLGWFSTNDDYFNKCESFIDMPFRLTPDSNNKDKIVNPITKSQKNRYSRPRQKQMYDNCQLLAPDGELLSMCDRTKAQWYIYKGLGNKVNDDPFTVQLNFEPSGRPTLDKVFFYCKEKLNSCVVCGKTENFHRKVVVPSEYRKYFPTLMKKGLSHDVLLLCMHCHKKSNILDQQMRHKLAVLCDAPFGPDKDVQNKLDKEISKVKSAAMALSSYKHKIPEQRREELKNVIANYYEVATATDELVEKAKNIDTNSSNSNFIPHGQRVYEYFCENGGLFEFEKMWRQHFLDIMKPQYLPDMWSVEHNHKRLATKIVNHKREFDFDEKILGLTPDLVKEIKELQ
ncbi:hypothetical protein JTE90_025753 [Oedothorax gibbosus]|uniref:Exonuclease 3'-5' domain-containing protein 2 n=1 Tax=Oedothorax gibbosus TaxID=931172 RepID=A0AAV6U671_9ARAC|nr:hypothetical protein JTE90_025753 [Oedothorax gibbosus]